MSTAISFWSHDPCGQWLYCSCVTLIAHSSHRNLLTLRAIYQVAEAIRQVVPTERLYILTLGSQQGNRHVHWHLAPLPPGVPYEQQQTAALDISQGVLAIPDDEMASLARSIRQAMEQLSPSSVSSPSN